MAGREGGHDEGIGSVVIAIGTNLAIAVAKFVAAALGGSAAMFAEGIHSAVDAGNEGFLLLGLRRSKKPADALHPFGYGRELYFWSLIVAIVIFGIGGGMAILEGISRLREPEPLGDPRVTYVVLGLSFVLESVSWVAAYRAVRAGAGEASTLSIVRASKDPLTFTVLVEDSAALAGLVIALGGTLLGHALHDVYLDGAASLLIGIVLAIVATFLVAESRSLLVGESARPEIVARIGAIAARDRDVVGVARALTMQLSPRDVLLNLDVRVRGELSGEAIVAAVARLDRTLRSEIPELSRVFIEPERETAT